MLVKVTFVQVRVLLLLGSENYSGTKIPYVKWPEHVIKLLIKYKDFVIET